MSIVKKLLAVLLAVGISFGFVSTALADTTQVLGIGGTMEFATFAPGLPTTVCFSAKDAKFGLLKLHIGFAKEVQTVRPSKNCITRYWGGWPAYATNAGNPDMDDSSQIEVSVKG